MHLLRCIYLFAIILYVLWIRQDAPAKQEQALFALDCIAFRASSQSLIGRVARYTQSSDFEMQLLNNTQYDCN